MNAGDLNHIIRIEEQVEMQDPVTLEITESWQAFVDDVPANVSPVSASELIASAQKRGAVQARIAFWWLPGITPKMRVVDKNENVIYAIDGVLPDNVNGRAWITLVGTTGVTDGS